MRDLAGEIACHGESGDAAQTVLRSPESGAVTGDFKFARKLVAKASDVSINAVGEGGHDGFSVGAIGGPLGVPVTPIVNRAGELVAIEGGRTEDFGELPGADAAPEIDLEEAVGSGDIALREEEVVDGGGIDVRNAPAIAKDFDLLLES